MSPIRPSPRGSRVVVSGLRNTHKNCWECDTGIAYVISGDHGWRTRRMTKIYDLSDPANPAFIRDFGLPGQQPGSTGRRYPPSCTVRSRSARKAIASTSATAPVARASSRSSIAQKLLSGPKEPTDANLLYPQIARIDLPPDAGAHTVFPVLGMRLPRIREAEASRRMRRLPGGGHDHGGPVPLATAQAHRDFIAVVSESLANECLEPRQMVRMIDITFESTPLGASTWTVPEASGDFCSRGGRFGSHSSNENFTPIYYGRVLFVTFFNAGLRALDIRDPFNVKEIGYYIPATTANTDRRCVGDRRQRAMQGGDPVEQRRSRRPRLHLRRRSREHGYAHPGTDGRGTASGELPGRDELDIVGT